MKRIVSLILTVLLAAGILCGCGAKPDIIFVNDIGISDKDGFNSGIWEGIQDYCREAKLNCKSITAGEDEEKNIATVMDAAASGAAMIVCGGYNYTTPVYKAQSEYPNVKFIIVDDAPLDADGKAYIAKNTISLNYAEEEAGFLAGYAAVRDGYRALGFIGGVKMPPVENYYFGYIQGAEYAAAELGLAEGAVSVHGLYSGDFNADAAKTELAKKMYDGGAEIIFACGGGITARIAEAAGEGQFVIGVDTDQSALSDKVITSAEKLLGVSVKNLLEYFMPKDGVGGIQYLGNAENGGVGLEIENAKFKTFSAEDYDAIYRKIAADEIRIQSFAESWVSSYAVHIKYVSVTTD